MKLLILATIIITSMSLYYIFNEESHELTPIYQVNRPVSMKFVVQDLSLIYLPIILINQKSHLTSIKGKCIFRLPLGTVWQWQPSVLILYSEDLAF